MADLTQGAPLPNITTTKTETTNAPAWYDQYLKDIAGAGTQAMGMTPDQLVAGFSPLQETAMKDVTAAGQAGQGAFKAGETAAGSVAAGLTPQRIQNLMNPYTAGVVNEMGRVSGLNTQRNVIPGLKAAFVGSGDVGSRRYAGATGQTLADIQANLLGQQTGALQKGYGDALQAAIQEMSAQRAAAETLGTLGTAEQTAALKGNQAEYQMGTEAQKLAQSKINAPLTAAILPCWSLMPLTPSLPRTSTLPATLKKPAKG